MSGVVIECLDSYSLEDVNGMFFSIQYHTVWVDHWKKA